MKVLVHPDQQPLATSLSDVAIEFTKRGEQLQKTLTQSGINIPANLRAEYNGRKVIKYSKDDPLFVKAFWAIYVPNALAKSGFRVQETNIT